MKNKKLLILLTGILTVMLCGCGTQSPVANNAVSTDSNTSNAVEDTSVSADTSIPEETEVTKAVESIVPDYTYETIEEYAEMESGGITLIYSLYLSKDDSSATMTQEYLFDDYTATLYTYKGKYEKNDSNIVFTHHTNNDIDNKDIYDFLLDNDKVISVEYMYVNENAPLAPEGEYTCNSDELGQLKLVVDNFSNAFLYTEDGKCYSGGITFINERFNLMASVNEEDSIDWYIDFLTGNTFEYESYAYATYKDYVGSYALFGSLGEFTLDVESDGSASATVNVDGMDVYFTGKLYIDPDTGTINDVYLSSDEGYSLELYLVFFDDEGFWNYSGYMTTPLSAG